MLMYITKVLYIFEHLKLSLVGIMSYKFGFLIWHMLTAAELAALQQITFTKDVCSKQQLWWQRTTSWLTIGISPSVDI